MARIRSLVEQVEIDTAVRAHNCQANAKHRIEKGHIRLAVKNGRSWDRYCQNCAQAIITRDIAELIKLKDTITRP